MPYRQPQREGRCSFAAAHNFLVACSRVQIDQEAEKLGITAKILLEVNVAKEESKFGMMPEEVPEMVEQISLLPHLQIEGLMTIAPFVDDPEKNRPVFQKLYQ